MEAGVSSAEGGGFGSEGLGFVDPDGRGFLELGAGARREGSGGGEDVGFESLAEFVGGGGGGVFGWGRRFVGSGVGFSIVVVVVVDVPSDRATLQELRGRTFCRMCRWEFDRFRSCQRKRPMSKNSK